MIVITNPIPIVNEINTIHALFECGLELIHVRKPDFSKEEMKVYLSKITKDYRSRLVLHQHHQLALDFGINRIHLTQGTRAKWDLDTEKKQDQFIKSTSTHCIEDFNALDKFFEYAFLSPVFRSISKENYHSKIDLFEAIKIRTNYSSQLVALGGIESINIEKSLRNGFDNVALLGTIWNSENPIKNFISCQKIALSF